MAHEYTYVYKTGSGSTCTFFYTHSHMRKPDNGHALISTKILKSLFFNSLVQNLFLNCVQDSFYLKHISQLWPKTCACFMSMVLGYFFQKSPFFIVTNQNISQIFRGSLYRLLN